MALNLPLGPALLPPCRFLNACCFLRQHRPVPHLWPWSESKTGNPGTGTPSPPVNMIAPEIF